MAGTSDSVVIPARNAVASDDGTSALAAEGGARVISTRGGRSACGARNAGWAVASGEVVVFLDAGAVPRPGRCSGVVRAILRRVE